MSGLIQAAGNINSLINCDQLTNYCYYMIFNHCTSLTQAPELPATTLADSCYYSMFSNCTNLSNINVSFTNWNSNQSTQYWLSYVSSNGTFTCPTALGTNTTITRDTSHCPTNWTVINK